jgi:invasion protein IalB
MERGLSTTFSARTPLSRIGSSICPGVADFALYADRIPRNPSIKSEFKYDLTIPRRDAKSEVATPPGRPYSIDKAELMTLMRFARSVVSLIAVPFIVISFLAMTLYPTLIYAQASAKPSSTKPAAKKPEVKKKPDAKKPDTKKPDAKASNDVPAIGGAQPNLLGQYGDWGAYAAAPGGKKVCFVISRPTATLPSGARRDPSYMFIATRPAEKVTEEISVILGYPTKPNVDGAMEIGGESFAMYTQNDGAWVKNAPDEPKLVSTLRGGAEAVVKAESKRGTKTTDTYSLKGVSQALDRAAQECK